MLLFAINKKILSFFEISEQNNKKKNSFIFALTINFIYHDIYIFFCYRNNVFQIKLNIGWILIEEIILWMLVLLSCMRMRVRERAQLGKYLLG